MQGANNPRFFLSGISEFRMFPIVMITLTILMCYGFELFNFHLTIDEELHAGFRNAIPGWAAQHRWGNYLLSFLIPTTVVPVVSIFVGLVLIAFSFWQLLTKVYSVDVLTATIASCIAITMPTLPFILAFSTIAYSIGVGFFLILLFGWVLSNDGRYNLLIAAILGGTAIAIYQTFIFVILILVAFSIILASDEKLGVQLKKGIFSVLLSLVFYFVADKLILWLGGIKPTEYVEGKINFDLSVEAIQAKVFLSFKNVWDILYVNEKKFGIHHPWQFLLFVLAVLGALYRILMESSRYKYVRIILLIAAIILPIGAEFLSNRNEAPLRAQIYMPIILLILTGFGVAFSNQAGRLLVHIMTFLLIVNNSVVSNHLFNSAEIAYQLDSRLASNIYDELVVQNLISDNTTYQIEIVGKKSWQETNLLFKSEIFGASFFEWGAGSRFRVAHFLTIQGLPTVGASERERVKLIPMAQKMPAYPAPGWVALEGNTIILKFGNYTPPQKASLRAHGGKMFFRNVR